MNQVQPVFASHSKVSIHRMKELKRDAYSDRGSEIEESLNYQLSLNKS